MAPSATAQSVGEVVPLVRSEPEGLALVARLVPVEYLSRTPVYTVGQVVRTPEIRTGTVEPVAVLVLVGLVALVVAEPLSVPVLSPRTI